MMVSEATIRFHVVTLFPELVDALCGHGVIGKAVEAGIIGVSAHQLRDYCGGSIHAVDDAPYGGGPGMVMRPEPIFAAVEDLQSRFAPASTILLSPQGRRFDQSAARRLASSASLLLFCGRYEGVDERVRRLFDEEISIGDFVMSGGEVAAAAVIDSVARLIPGVLGSKESIQWETFSEALLEYPQYTRPESFRGMTVPAVLTSGNHARIEAWRRAQALARTRERRPDLLERETTKRKS